MENLVKYLEQLDLTDVEAQMYLTLLQTGPAAVRDLAQSVGVKRTTAYLYIEHLLQKGLITRVTSGAKSKVAPTDPDSSLESLVEDKLAKAKDMQAEFPTILTSIQQSIQQAPEEDNADVRYYKGKTAVRSIYEESLREPEVRSYVNLSILADKVPENTQVFSEALNRKEEIVMYEIFVDSILARKQASEFLKLLNDPSRYKYKFLPHDIQLSAADILIYNNKVANINVRNQIVGVVIQDADYYRSSKEIFDLLWKLLPTPLK